MKNILTLKTQFVPMIALSFVILSGLEVRAEDWASCAAKKIVTSFEEDQNSPFLTYSILNLTHPTGKQPKITSVEALKSICGNQLSVVVTLKWNGGFTNTGYTTVVTWKFNQFKHVSATVTSDNAVVDVSTENKLRLNTYFQDIYDSVFPVERR